MPTTLQANDPGAVQAAAQRLADGLLVGLPTETVYGVAADACHATAVQRIFEAKGRPSDHPLIVHIAAPIAPANTDDSAWGTAVAPFARNVPPFAWALMRAFWPGPLTLILPRQPEVAAVAAGGHPSVGLRCPAHPVAQAVLVAARAQGVLGVAAPSANRFGRISPTTAQHVAEEFAHLTDADLLILDGGACAVGIESTIVDATRSAPVLLRPGAITAEQVSAACGVAVVARDDDAPRSSGDLAAHYAPRAKLRLMTGPMLKTALQILGSDAQHIAVYARQPLRGTRKLPVRRMPNEPQAAAHELFAVLRELDAPGVRLIWVEEPPEGEAWDGVRDRLSRAARA